MQVRSLLSRQKRTELYLHVAMAGLATLTNWFLIFWIYFRLGSLATRLGKGKKAFFKNRNYIFGLVLFLVSQEVLSRAAMTIPFIPHEFSKYLLTMFLLVIGVQQVYGKTNIAGLLLVISFIPSVILAYTAGMLSIAGFVNGALGLVNIALGVWVLKGKRVEMSDLIYFLRLLLFAAVMLLVFVFIKTPNYDDIKFDLVANTAASGGFGSNQVSTVLGMGLLITGLSYIKGYKLSGFVLLDGLLFFAFLFQGLLTFSRGGILVGGIALLIFVLLQFGSLATRMKSKIIFGFFLIIVGTIVVFAIADEITGGTLSLRYKGETAGTLIGAKERNLNQLTTGRYNIMVEDLTLWLDSAISFIFGVGIGVSQEIRGGDLKGISAHVELSRMLAEQGLMGLIFFVYMISLGLRLFRNRSDFRDIQVALFVLAILTTFHAAMRTFVTPALMILCMFDELRPKVQVKKEVDSL